MSGVSNLRQVVSSTQAVERVQEAQNRSQQAGQQHFAESLEREAKDETEKVTDNPDVKRAAEREHDERERDSDEEPEEARDDEADDEDGEHRVDIVV